MSPWKVQYSICNYYRDKDTVLYVSSHREKTEAVAIATARRALNKSTNNIAQDFSTGSHLMWGLELQKSCPLKGSETCLGVSRPKVFGKNLLLFSTLVFQGRPVSMCQRAVFVGHGNLRISFVQSTFRKRLLLHKDHSVTVHDRQTRFVFVIWETKNTKDLQCIRSKQIDHTCRFSPISWKVARHRNELTE